MVTVDADYPHTAIAEVKRLDKQLTQVDEFAPGIILCSQWSGTNPTGQHRPTFVRHIAPVQITIDLTNSPRDLEEIAVALAELPTMALLERGTHFAVQTRLVQTDKTLGERPYSGGQINQALAEVISEETGAAEDVKKPQVVVS